MSVLARKITRAKWEPNPELGAGEVAADAATGDLRTAGNTAGLATQETLGDTPVVSLRELHVDIARLDLVRLGAVARMVADAHRTNAALRMTKKEVLDLMASAVREKLVGIEDLKGEMRTKVEARLHTG